VYRYGFNGKENDNDAGEGIQDYGMRIYSERLGRFLSVDPITKSYPFYTPYQFAGNSPILSLDLDGLEPNINTNKNEKKTTTDAGHGDKPTGHKYLDPGSVSVDQKEKEKDYALVVESAVNDRLKELNVNNTRTRTGDVDNAGARIQWRVNFAKGSDIFVSIHLNNGANDDIKVYYEPKISNEQNSIKLGLSIINETTTLIGIPTDQGIISTKKTGVQTVGVLRLFKGDAGVLIEVGGIKSETTRTYIATRASEIGKKIADGMYKYMYGEVPKSEKTNTWEGVPFVSPKTSNPENKYAFPKNKF